MIECPRDALQSYKPYVSVDRKAAYINALLKVGFDTIDFGSFVSHKAIPQLHDTAEVVKKLDLSHTSSKLLAIIGNMKGAQSAADFDEIFYLGFPHSSSKTFLKLNINATPDKARKTISEINNLCVAKNKQLVVYLAVAFGNPYGDDANFDLTYKAVADLKKEGIKIIGLADTLGLGNPELIAEVFSRIIPAFPEIEFGFHLHTSSSSWFEKVQAAYQNGCRRFDSVMMGRGGCPMSSKELVGNLSTENLLSFFKTNDIDHNLIERHYFEALKMAGQIFP